MLIYWGRFGALPQLTLELAEASARLKTGVPTTISISKTNELFDRYASLGESIFPVTTYSSPPNVFNASAFLRLRDDLKRRLIKDGTRGCVTLMPHIWSPLVVPMVKRLGIRHTVIIHDADPHLGDRTALVNKWFLREARLADHVVTLTTSVAERLIEMNVVPRDKISVLFHPDLTYRRPSTDTQTISSPLRVAFFGRILPYKGLSLFVKAMEILKSAGVAIDVGVFGAGSLGTQRDSLKRLNAEVLNGWIDPAQVGGILARHDVIVASHTKASQSGVIAAAHGAGVPVVAAPVGGLKEQIIPEVTGVIASDTTAEAIAAAVQRLAEDRNLLLRIQQGIKATRETRSIDRFLCELSEIALRDV